MQVKQEFRRRGMYAGKVYEFTHWDPESNKMWSDDVPNGPKIPDGRWVKTDRIKWVGQEVQ